MNFLVFELTSDLLCLILSKYEVESFFWSFQLAGPRNDSILYETPLTCSICELDAEPKCNTLPSAGDTKLHLSIIRQPSLSDRVKNSDKLR